MNKPYFTEDLSNYMHFLEACNVSIAASIHTMQQEIDVHQKIIALIKRYQKGATTAKKDLTEIAKICCPDFMAINALEKQNSDLYASAEEIVLDCSKTTCEICWKNYINQTARILNRNFVDVKLYDPTEDDDHGNQDPEE